MDIQTLREHLLKSWQVASTPDVVNAYIKIFDHITSEPCNNMQHMLFSSFSRIVDNSSINDDTLVEIVFHLINVGRLLDLNYEFIDGELCFDIPVEMIVECEKTGVFHHPETGCEVLSYKSKIFMYFTPSSELKDLKRNIINLEGGDV